MSTAPQMHERMAASLRARATAAVDALPRTVFQPAGLRDVLIAQIVEAFASSPMSSPLKTIGQIREESDMRWGSRWVNVADRLPVEEGFYLVGGWNYRAKIGWRDFANFRMGSWWGCDEDAQISVWWDGPLPVAPTREQAVPE